MCLGYNQIYKSEVKTYNQAHIGYRDLAINNVHT